jgi:hypothetical protein
MTVRKNVPSAVAAMIISKAVRPKACLATAGNPTVGADTCDVAAPARLTALLIEAETGIPL